MRRQASRDEESSGTKWDNIFNTKSQRIQEGESTKSARKVITDYAYAYRICTHTMWRSGTWVKKYGLVINKSSLIRCAMF